MSSFSLSLKSLFSLLFLLFVGLLTATALAAWSGPPYNGTCGDPPCPPGGNVPAPINVGTTDQVKNGGLSVNGLSVYGRQYLESGLEIGVHTDNTVTALNVNGTIKLGDGGEQCTGVTAGAIHYNTSNQLEYCNGSAWGALGSAAAGQWSISGSDIYYNAGKVGIGTASPSYLLSLSANDPRIYFEDTAGSPKANYSIRNGDGKLYVRDETNGVDRLAVTSTGVGIGVTAPSVPLEVSGKVKLDGSLPSGWSWSDVYNVSAVQYGTTHTCSYAEEGTIQYVPHGTYNGVTVPSGMMFFCDGKYWEPMYTQYTAPYVPPPPQTP